MQALDEPELPYWNGAVVELTDNLIRYHPSLAIGTHGIITNYQSRLGDRFAIVSFPKAGNMDVLYKGLKLVKNDEYHQRNVIFQADHKKQIAASFNVSYVTGPRGGFRYLEYSYKTDTGTTIERNLTDKTDAELWLRNFKAAGINVTRKTEQ